jgi:zinc protease
MKLVAELLRDSVFPASEFELLKQERLAAIEQQRSEPQSLAMTTLQKQLNPYVQGDVRYISSIDESIKDLNAVTLEQAKAFYKQFYGASTGELSVIGDFDSAAIKKQVDQLFGTWRAPEKFVRVPSIYQSMTPINQTIETPDKANAVYFAGMPIQLRDDDADYPAMVLANYMLGGGFLNSRLAVRVRQQEGLSYGVGSQFNASALDKVGTFIVYAIYAPQNLAKLELAIKEELQRAIKDGFTSEEIQAAKSGWLQSRQVSRAQDAELASKLSNYQFLNRSLAWDEKLEQQVAALTPTQISSALQRYLNLNQLHIVKAGDFAKAVTSSSTGSQ